MIYHSLKYKMSIKIIHKMIKNKCQKEDFKVILDNYKKINRNSNSKQNQ